MYNAITRMYDVCITMHIVWCMYNDITHTHTLSLSLSLTLSLSHTGKYSDLELPGGPDEGQAEEEGA